MRIVKQLVGVLALGYILMFYSESLFWAHVRPGQSLSERMITWLVYSIVAYVFLSVLARFRVFSVWALFLAGAVYGWLLEGLIVQTAYEALPLSISFTGLAWHALITILVGFYLVPRALARGCRAFLLPAAIGLGYGFWAITWWVEPDGGLTQPLDFAIYAFSTTILLCAAYEIFGRTVPRLFQPSRKADILVSLCLFLYFIFITIPSAPLAAVILPALLAGVFLTLRHNKQVESGGSLLDSLPGARQVWPYLGLLAMPLTATVFYAVAFHLGIRWHSNGFVYLITTPAGFILLLISLIKVWRMKPSAA
jgi:hypothetical protein